MNEKKPTGQSIMSTIGSVIATSIVICIFMTSEVHADLETFADEIQTRIQLDIQHYWDDDDAAAIAARRELNNQARDKIVSGWELQDGNRMIGLNEMFSGQNLDPGMGSVWRGTGVDGFMLHYPRPNYPDVILKRVYYWKVPFVDPGAVLFGVDWDAHWRGLPHATDNGPYIYFRITGGYGTGEGSWWARRHDVQIHIDRMNMTMHGNTLFVVYSNGDVDPATQVGSIGSVLFGLPEMYYIRYANPNNWGWRERVGNRIIEEIRSNYSDRIKRLVFKALLVDFMTLRMDQEITTREDRLFWARQRDWALSEESDWGTYIIQ